MTICHSLVCAAPGTLVTKSAVAVTQREGRCACGYPGTPHCRLRKDARNELVESYSLVQ